MRHPIYSAIVVLAIGVALLVPKPVSLAAVITFVIAVELQTRVVEEPYLMRIHDYAGYGCQTGRFVPGIGRISGHSSF